MHWQDSGGRVDLESLKDGELDYGCDQAGLAELRQRTRTAVHNYEGKPGQAWYNGHRHQPDVLQDSKLVSHAIQGCGS